MPVLIAYPLFDAQINHGIGSGFGIKTEFIIGQIDISVLIIYQIT